MIGDISIDSCYKTYGVDGFYIRMHDCYFNPHINDINTLLEYSYENWKIGKSVLDLCCGGGEVTQKLLSLDETINFLGVDPYTYNLYNKNTNKDSIAYNFKDICLGKLDEYKFDTIICSYALHLCEVSMLPLVLWQLSQISNQLIIITPHKRPECNGIMGWRLEDKIKIRKSTAKLYRL